MAKKNPAPATQKADPAQAKPALKTTASAQAVLFPKQELLMLKLGSVQVPHVEDGKGVWLTVTQAQWNLEHQRNLFNYWSDRKREDTSFDIEAKKLKLFILPEQTETISSAQSVELEVEVKEEEAADQIASDGEDENKE